MGLFFFVYVRLPSKVLGYRRFLDSSPSVGGKVPHIRGLFLVCSFDELGPVVHIQLYTLGRWYVFIVALMGLLVIMVALVGLLVIMVGLMGLLVIMVGLMGLLVFMVGLDVH